MIIFDVGFSVRSQTRTLPLRSPSLPWWLPSVVEAVRLPGCARSCPARQGHGARDSPVQRMPRPAQADGVLRASARHRAWDAGWLDIKPVTAVLKPYRGIIAQNSLKLLSVDMPAGHAFISYVREDSHEVDQLQRTLEAAGVSVWRDRADLWPGEDWRGKIRRAITENALVFIACFSSRSAARVKSYQNEELVLAIDELRQRRPDVPWLIPIRFNDCAIPEYDIGGGRTLASIQRVDFFGDRRDVEVARLVTAILRLLEAERTKQRAEEEIERIRKAAGDQLERFIYTMRYALHREAIDYHINLEPDGTCSIQVGLRLKNNFAGYLRYEIQHMEVVIEDRTAENPQFYNRGVIIPPGSSDTFRYPFIPGIPVDWHTGSIKFTVRYGHPSGPLRFQKSQELNLRASRVLGTPPPNNLRIDADLVSDSDVEDV